MLLRIKVRDFAIIDELEVEFSEGLNIITGETGAGKSIIVNALSLLCGERGSVDYIRTGKEEAEIEGVFNIHGRKDIVERLKEKGLFMDEEQLFIRRIISRGGKGRLYINTHLVPLGILSSLMEGFVDIYSQGENLLLLRGSTHIDMLDEFGGIIALRDEFSRHYRRFKEVSEILSGLQMKLKEREARRETLSFQLKEIRDADVKDGEEEELKRIRSMVLNRQRLLEGISTAHRFLYEAEGSSLETINKAISSLKGIEKIEQKLSSIITSLEDARIKIMDVAEELGRLLGDMDQDISLDAVEERLERIHRLKRKYGQSYQEIMDYASRVERELNEMEDMEGKVAEKERELEEIRQEVIRLAMELSAKRRDACLTLEGLMQKELSTIGLKGSRFSVKISSAQLGGKDLKGITAKGIDEVEFYFSANPSEDPKPLLEVASGGELSRLMLALKKVLFRGTKKGILVFDEIDTGIGGAMAEVVGKKLKETSRYHQVLCITHLPQIACFADMHLCIIKESSRKETSVEVKRLDYKGRVMEIARMLSGLEVTQKTIAHAKEMIERASRMCI